MARDAGRYPLRTVVNRLDRQRFSELDLVSGGVQWQLVLLLLSGYVRLTFKQTNVGEDAIKIEAMFCRVPGHRQRALREMGGTAP